MTFQVIFYQIFKGEITSALYKHPRPENKNGSNTYSSHFM